MRWRSGLLAALMLMLLVGIGNAGPIWTTYDLDMDGDGTLTYPNEGWITHEAYDRHSSTMGGQSASHTYPYYHPSDKPFNLYISGYGSMDILEGTCHSHNNRIQYYMGSTPYWICPAGCTGAHSYSGIIHDTATPSFGKHVRFEVHANANGLSEILVRQTVFISPNIINYYNISGSMECLDNVTLYTEINNTWQSLGTNNSNSYSFRVINGITYILLFSDGHGYEFTVDGVDIEYNYDACTWVYGYTCGIDSIRLYVDDGGSWVVDEIESQFGGYANYEIPITDGKSYLVSFVDCGFVIHNQTFTCTGDHVNIDFDRCNWVYPPSPWDDPIPIYIWTGYDYNIVVFRDAHGNFIENSKLAIYDKTDNQYLQRWTDAADGYTLLGTKFDTDHDVLLSLRTFDGVFTLDTVYPANGSALVGEENITTTNWTIPIKYNLNVLPVDQYGMALFDVFCGLSEYTPLNPGAFWGMDLSDRGYVPVTNCSGFSMCDIIAEKGGYADYKVEALNWTSKSALVKDYRHNIVMEEE